MIDLLINIPKYKVIIKQVKVYQYQDTVFNHQKTWKHIPTKHLDTFYPFNIITEEIYDND